MNRAEEIRAQYAAIVESSDDAIIAKDLDGVISAWNAGAERMFGYTAQEAIGQPIIMIIPPDLHEEEHGILRRLRAGERIEHLETVRVTKAGERIHVSLTISPLRDEAGTISGCAKIARDITKAKQAEAALRESEERFRVIANTAPVMICMTDAEKQITYLNQIWLDYIGRPLDTGLARRFDVVHPDDAERFRDVGDRALEGRAPFQLEHRLRRHDGEYHWVVTAAVPRYHDGSFAGYIGTTIDINERKLAEEALSTVSQKLIEAHEEERTRIARELHDDINQRLALLGVRLDRLKPRSSSPVADLEEAIEGVQQEIAGLSADVQALSHGLHPARVELLGLEAATAGFCEELSARHSVTIDIHCENIPQTLPREISLCLYRVLQEGLQNAVKHSASQHVAVSLVGHINTVVLIVEDSGAGFDAHEAIRGPGLGLTSMRERLKVIGGKLAIHSRPGRGTMIQAVAPRTLR